MPNPASDPRAQASVVDRLLDDDPKNSRDPVVNRAQSVGSFKASVRRDLEWLLNTRCTASAMPPDLAEVWNSLYSYGLPDIGSFAARSPGDRERLGQAIRRAIEIFEPRLADVTVAFDSEIDSLASEVRFSIHALLLMDPVPEQVSFDAFLDAGKGSYQVKGD